MVRALPQILLVVLLSNLWIISPATAAQSSIPSPQKTPSSITSPDSQLVRISYLQGTAKVSLGLDDVPVLGNDWVAAGVNFPIQEGATLATEQGRAEVEFENGSMVYLAEHSVLQFLRLATTPNGTSTKVFLVLGRATFAVESNGHDVFTIKTPVVLVHLTSAKTVRVESALDGAIFRVVDGRFRFSGGTPGETFSVGPGDAFQCVNSMLSPLPDLLDDPEQANWDQWVNDERMARKADLQIALQQSGLAAPIPGLVELARGGTFTDCVPFGRCWEPNPPEAPQSAAQTAPIPQPNSRPIAGKSAQKCDATQNPGVRCEWVRAEEGTWATYEGPCGRGPRAEKHYWVDKLLLITPQDPQGQVVDQRWGIDFWDYASGFAPAAYPGWWRFPWATCRAGSWIPEPHHFSCKPEKGKPGKCSPPKKWVVGRKRKGGSFLRVREGKREGFIPRHPLDVKGKPPLNAHDGVLTFRGKGFEQVEEIKSPPKDLQIVKSLASGYPSSWSKNLPKADKPVIEARLLTSRTDLSGQTIHFDYKTKNFVAEVAGIDKQTVIISHLNQPTPHDVRTSGGQTSRSAGSPTTTRGTNAGASRTSSRENSSSGHISSSRSASSSSTVRESSQNSYRSSGTDTRSSSPPPTSSAPAAAPSTSRTH